MMNKNISTLAPQLLWNNFQALCNIPRVSKNETAVMNFIREKCKSLGLDVLTDSVNNTVVRKPATKGYENRKTVILQAHVDMVPQKNSDKIFDFATDPIEAYIDGDWVKANGTTLGADNGIGVAAMLAILESKNLEHGAIEALFTIDEETGMTGAFELDSNILKGEILLNLDTEEEGELCVGCAGGLNTSGEITYTKEDVPANSHALLISIKGLKGGHSGLDINLGRGNAIKILTRIIWHLNKTNLIRISHFSGGSLRNAIARESSATIVVDAQHKNKLVDAIQSISKEIKSELKATEENLSITVETTSNPSFIIDSKTQNNLLNVLYALPHGAFRMIDDIPNVVETSTNLAAVKQDDHSFKVLNLLRSSVDSAKTSLGNQFTAIFEMGGFAVQHNGDYPGWRPNFNSHILTVMTSTYAQLYGKEPKVKVVHAGLECGIIGAIYPTIEMISFGPDIRFPHSPDEKVKIDSVGKFWDYLLETLKSA